MNLWLQTRQFKCPKCGEQYVHDKGYQHELFLCPNRNTAEPFLVGGLTVPAGIENEPSVPALNNQCA